MPFSTGYLLLPPEFHSSWSIKIFHFWLGNLGSLYFFPGNHANYLDFQSCLSFIYSSISRFKKILLYGTLSFSFLMEEWSLRVYFFSLFASSIRHISFVSILNSSALQVINIIINMSTIILSIKRL